MNTDVLPSAPEAELRLNARILRHPPTLAKDARPVWTDDLIDPHHRAFFSACRELHFASEPLDPMLLAEKLAGRGPFADKAAVAVYMIELDAAADNADAALSVRLIREAAHKRRVRATCETAIKATANGQASSTIVNDLLSDLGDIQRDYEPRQRFTAITTAELDSGSYDLKYIIRDVLVEGQPCILAGPKKALKTTFLVAMGLSIGIGADFLGKFQVSGAKRFLLCSGESGLATLQETARRIATSMGWNLAEVPGFTITPDLPQLGDAEHLSDFERFLESQSAEIVAIDPAYLCMPGDDAGNLFKQGVLLRNISELCQRQGVTLILAHHAKRHVQRDQFAAPELDDIAWAGFSEFARQWLLLGRREIYEPGTGDHRLWLSIGGSAGHSGLYAVDVTEGSNKDPGGRRFKVNVQFASEAREEAAERRQTAKQRETAKRIEADMKAICEAAAALPDRTGTKTDIKDASGLNESRFRPALGQLLKNKQLLTTTIKKGNNRDYEGYKLACE